MALELLANNAQTTTTGAIDGSTNPVTFVVASASAFPATGNFRVIIDAEIMLVTAVAGTSFTASRAQEGTSIASHLSGATLTHVLTAASLKKIVGEFHILDAYANIPAAGLAGRRFTPTDWKGLSYYDDGSAWKNVLRGGKIVSQPSLALLGTFVNQETATFTQSQGALKLEDPGVASGEDFRIVVKSSSATVSIQIDACVQPYHNNVNDILVYGGVFRKSSNGVCEVVGIIQRNSAVNVNTFLARLSNANTIAASNVEVAMTMMDYPVWLRAKVTLGTSLYELFVSYDGFNYNRMASITDTNVANPDQVGLFINLYDSTSGQAGGMDILELSTTEV